MTKERIITGIDVGSTKIATTIAVVSDKKVSVIGVSGNVESKGIKKGNVVKIDGAVEAISSSLERAERMAGVSVSSAFVTVNGSHIETRNSHGVVAVSPHLSSEISAEDVARVTEAAQAISLPSTREIIHVIPRDFVVDSQDGIKDPIGMTGNRLEVETNIIHGSSTAIINLTKCIEQVGVSVEDMIFSGIASAEAVLTDTEKELGTLLIDIGGGATSIIAYVEGAPIHSAVLPIGAKYITNDLAVGLRIRMEDAENIKLKLSNDYALLSKTKQDDREEEFDVSELSIESEKIPKKVLYRIIDARLEEILSLISLEMAKVKLRGQLPAGVVVTGGGAMTAGVERVVQNILKTPVRIGRPTGVTGLIDEIQGPQSSSTVGAVLYGAELYRTGSLLSFEKSRGNISSKFSTLFSKLKNFLP
ncbi:cell division protein FtsA [candidate division WWE3 bacterium RBG_19FT_COMBO_34_6]|uniref:Cell division protein FtsA n=1 Tax=candidate division WWE3 bacterium RBG_19FT_COMBO_34_6 TaxID=1802612 RepID=A0A1F4UKQ3_UNCKA|nr:MAG: cell division protein FtsA [candidate division WWE3 bacterium RBG_19FT_COMBO_34_6]